MSLSENAFILKNQITALTTAQFFGASDWVWIIIFILALVLVWWLMSRAADLSREESQELTTKILGNEAKKTTEEVVQEPDDLTIIEGIGPKINQIFQEAGIQTYEQLSNTDLDTLKSLLEESRLSFADPKSWPEQAKLAYVENWDELEEMQDKLKGGRRE